MSEPHADPSEPRRYEAHRDNPQPEPIAPNAPSSPQWSLSDARSETRSAELEPGPARPAAQDDFAPSKVTESAEAIASEPEEPREARKGWWQRRFKI